MKSVAVHGVSVVSRREQAAGLGESGSRASQQSTPRTRADPGEMQLNVSIMVRRAEKFHEVKHDAVNLTGLLWDSWKGCMSHLTRKKMLSLQVRACFHYALAFSQQLSWRLRPSLAAFVSIRLWLRRTTSPMGRDIDPGPCRRPSGRRFVLHRTFGPRLRYAALQPNPLHLLELLDAAAAARLQAATRYQPHPPPSPKPWPLSDLHFHSSDLPFGHSCLVSALSVCPLCRPVRRIERPLRPSGRLPGRREERRRWPQRLCRRRRRSDVQNTR